MLELFLVENIVEIALSLVPAELAGTFEILDGFTLSLSSTYFLFGIFDR